MIRITCSAARCATRPRCFGRNSIRRTCTTRTIRSVGGLAVVAAIWLAAAAACGRPRDVPAVEDPIKVAAALAERAHQRDSAGSAPASRFVKTERGLVADTGDSAALAAATVRVVVWRGAAGPDVLEVQPIDPGGDAVVTFRYYFDDRERVRLIEVRGSTFHSGCTNVLRIHRRLTFGANGDSVAGEQTLTDRADQPVTSTSCELPDAMVPPRYPTYADAVRAGVAPAR